MGLYISEDKIVIDQPNYMLANTNGPAKLPNSSPDSKCKLALSLPVVQSAAIVCIVQHFCSVGLRLMKVLHKRKEKQGLGKESVGISPSTAALHEQTRVQP